MKKIIFLLVLGINFCSVCFADNVINLNAIETIESNHNPLAFNKKMNARGLYQITPINLKDYNQVNKTSIKPDELFNPIINKKIATWYFNVRLVQFFNHYHITLNEKNLIVAYNSGINTLVKKKSLPIETILYLKKYSNLTATIKKEGR